MEVIDLRSDTVTQPTAAMRRAIRDAELGDDVFEDDPTVKRLEELAARLLGKEAALFMASGTMANLVAVLTHTRRGDEVIVGDESHILHYEVGGAAALGGVLLRAVPNDRRGRLRVEDVAAVIRPPDIHFPRTALLCLENTHNRCGGTALSPEDLAPVVTLAHRHGIPIHLDGARIFNAAVALGVPAMELARDADSVMFCLSKGLSAPVGSLLCGSRAFIERARRVRKMLGGGMRQVGVVAAAGIVALETMIDRLMEDHAHARYLAERLAELPGVELDPATVETNIVVFTLRAGTADEFLPRLAQAGVLATNFGPRRIRLVTHYGIERRHIEEAVARIARILPVAV
ncbi:MAG: low-specificity L-threonine aldolase [Chloroflexota bacterium]